MRLNNNKGYWFWLALKLHFKSFAISSFDVISNANRNKISRVNVLIEENDDVSFDDVTYSLLDFGSITSLSVL